MTTSVDCDCTTARFQGMMTIAIIWLFVWAWRQDWSVLLLGSEETIQARRAEYYADYVEPEPAVCAPPETPEDSQRDATDHGGTLTAARRWQRLEWTFEHGGEFFKHAKKSTLERAIRKLDKEPASSWKPFLVEQVKVAYTAGFLHKEDFLPVDCDRQKDFPAPP